MLGDLLPANIISIPIILYCIFGIFIPADFIVFGDVTS